MIALPNLETVLAALPDKCSQRLRTIGLTAESLRDPDRLLRRAIGAPQEVSLVDLELDPERWHGAYVVTSGTVGWSRETTCLGRVWLNPALHLYASGPSFLSIPPVFQARVSGVLLSDAQVRAQHRQRHHSPGGYGHFGLFVAELVASSIRIEQGRSAPKSSASSAGRLRALTG